MADAFSISWHSPDVFRWTRILPVQAHRPAHVWVRHTLSLIAAVTPNDAERDVEELRPAAPAPLLDVRGAVACPPHSLPRRSCKTAICMRAAREYAAIAVFDGD
ncbi:hypothetical protein [Burkholderia cepacia]|uniref:hypothetical protein n=1 Tax=Burkholderia cepacia TaxID=292 RepID=UPI001E531D8C|nr:hypothetical protein [Burkholderia cepacia]